MLDSVINKAMRYVADFYKGYDIDFIIQYNSDLEMLSQYSKSLDTRALFLNIGSDMSIISNEDLANLRKDGHILMMYNYSPLKRSEDKFNNINWEAVFDPRNPQGINEIQKFHTQEELQEGEIELLSTLRELNADEAPNMFTVRDMIYGEINFTCKFLTTSSKLLNDLQFLHIQKLQRNREIEMSFNFGDDIGRVDFPYETQFEAIEDIGHVDYNSYGNLQQLTFTYTLKGPFFSPYSTKIPILDGIDLTLGFKK